jgi:outer membrane protein W
MKTKNRAAIALAAVSVFLMFALCSTNAEAGDRQWVVRATVLSMKPTGDSVVVDGDDNWSHYTADAEYGFGIDFEYRASRLLGIDFGVLSASPELDVVYDAAPMITATAKLRITPIYTGLNLHLTPDSQFDLSLGPVLAYVVYSGFDLVVNPLALTEEGFESEDEFGFGVNLGLDVRLGDDGWLLTAAFRYLNTTLKAAPPDEGTGSTAIDPKIFSIGVGYRF